MSVPAALLTDLPLFESLGPEERDLLAGVVDVRKVPEGEFLFKAGDPGQAMYIVVSGEIEISVTDRAGQKIVLNDCHRGDTFGELAMLDAGPRSASARAVEDTELVELDRSDVLLLVTRKPESALHMLGALGAMTRKADLLLRTRVARNANEAIEEKLPFVLKLADWIAAFSGSMTFLCLNAAWFGAWIWLNVSGVWRFDPYPFGLLTMIVSLQAIFLSIFVLLAQNRQAAKERVRDDLEYEINVKAELEVAHLHEKVEEIREGMLVRLQRMEALLADLHRQR
jgi:uncharacterized membrane protein